MLLFFGFYLVFLFHLLDKPKIEKAANTAFGKAARKTLADISNLQPQMRTSNQNEKPQNIPMDTKQYIAKLEKVLL